WHDQLTGLPNRARLRAEIERRLSSNEGGQTSLALLLVDLDRFKEVNDTMGHPCGDLLLQQVAARFKAHVGEADMLARLGGDEFALLVQNASEDLACGVAERLHRLLEVPFELEGSLLEIGGSMGVVLYPEHGADADV